MIKPLLRVTITKRARPGLLIVLVGLSFCFSAIAKVKFYTLVEKTRSASLIQLAEIQSVGPDTIILLSHKVLKGLIPVAPLEMPWPVRSNFEMPIPALRAGDPVLLFASRKGDSYEPFAGPQGILKLESNWAAQYEATIAKIRAFDAAASADGKTSNLVAMLQSEIRLSNLSGLEIVYLEYHAKNFRTEELVKPIARLAESSDIEVATYAIQVMSRVGDKSVIPLLIKLLSAPNDHVADRANRVLKSLTRTDFEFDAKQSLQDRAKAVKRWSDWWATHQDQVTLDK